MGRDDDLVGRGLELRERVPNGLHRIGIDDEPVRGDPVRAEQIQCLVEPAAGRGAAGVLVDDVACARLVDRADDRDPDRPVGGTPVERLRQALPGHRLVGDDEHVPRLLGPGH